MKTILLKVVFLFLGLINFTNAQPLLWGTENGSGTLKAGTIYSVPLGGGTPTVQYEFQTIYSRSPSFSDLAEGVNDEFWGMTTNSIFTYSAITGNYKLESLIGAGGSLYKASNGKIYGVGVGGFIIEIDPVSKSINPKLVFATSLSGKLFEYTPGKLIGVAGSDIFEYDYVANTVVVKKTLTTQTGYDCYGSAVKAPNGKIYFLFNDGGASAGTVCEYDAATGGITVVYVFLSGTGSLGCRPRGSLTVGSNGLLYGLAGDGGPTGSHGTIFSIDPSTGAYNMLHSFSNSINGIQPWGSLTLSPNGLLYGFCYYGGAYNYGTLFSFNTFSNQFTKVIDLNDFTGRSPNFGNLMVASTGNMYVMFTAGNLAGKGGLYEFDYANGNLIPRVNFNTGLEGNHPAGKLFVAPNNKIYSTTIYGGTHDKGTIYEFNLSNFSHSKLIDFTITNGARPYGGLMQASDGKLYGMTAEGGNTNNGVIYQFDIGSNIFNVIHHFSGTDGAHPQGELIEYNGKLYGLTMEGGIYNLGVIFEFDLTGATYNKKVDIDSSNCNLPYGSLTLMPNGIMYGLGVGGSQSSAGGIFSYSPATNTFTTKKAMASISCGGPTGTMILAPNGKLYGAAGYYTSNGAIYEYAPSTNTLTLKFNSSSLRNVAGSLYLASNGKLYGIATDNPSFFEYDYITNTYNVVASAGNTNFLYPKISETNFTCVNATTPVIAFNSSAICFGDSIQLNLASGSLNNANRWQWFAGGCGVNPIDTGSSIYVKPTATTTYYVRAEGGCSTPTVCDSVQINVYPSAASISALGRTSFCLGGSVTLTSQIISGSNYQWRKNNATIAGATQYNYTVSSAGTYNVNITNGTCSLISNAITVAVLCFPPGQNDLRTLPDNESIFNVTKPIITFNKPFSLKLINSFSPYQMWLELFDVSGRCTLKQEIFEGENNIELSNYFENTILFYLIKSNSAILKSGKILLNK